MMRRRLFALVVLALPLAISAAPASGQSANRKAALASEYVTLRAAVFKSDWRAPARGKPDGAQLDQLAAEVARDLGKATPGWGPSHPGWARVVAAIRKDLGAMAVDTSSDARYAALSTKIVEAAARSFERTLSQPELQGLVRFYGSPAGRRFNAAHTDLLEIVVTALDRMPQPPPAQPPLKPADKQRLGEIAALIEDVLVWTAATVDPASMDEAAVQQAMRSTLVPAVRSAIGPLSVRWQQVPPEERRAVLAFLDSPLGVRERTAIREAGRSVRSVVDIGSEMGRLGAQAARKEKEWRALLPK